jgi:hypothetical protein
VTKQDLDRLVADASPIRDADLAGFDFERGEAELIQEIIASPDAPTEPGGKARFNDRHHRGLRRWPVLSVAAVAAAFIVAFVTFGLIRQEDEPVFAAAAIKVAEANPRLLMTAPGWSVTRADEFTTDEGEMAFGNGSDEVELFWRPASQYQSYLRDREVDSDAQTEAPFLGHPATMFTDTNTGAGVGPSFDTVVAPEGKTFVEIRGDDLGSEDAYRGLLDSFERTDVDTWLSAMPASVVQPAHRAATVEQMLEGIPLPPGFDTAALKRGDAVLDRYQLGARVAGSIACAWLDRWSNGLAKGDTAEVQQAKDALSTSRDWPILQEMNKQGDYPKVIWDFATDRSGGSGFGPNTSHNYNISLGCNHLSGG